METIRQGSYGSTLVPAGGVGRRRWDASAPLIVEALPAGHIGGQYSLSISTLLVAAGSAGTYAIAVSWDEPGFGAVSAVYSAALALNAAVGSGFLGLRNVASSGQAPIVYTLTPAAVAGAPVLQVNLPVDLVAMGYLPAGFP